MASKAGHKPDAVTLTADNIYSSLMDASEGLDDAEVPEVGRVLLVTPATYALMKQSALIALDTDVGQEMRLRGVIGVLDGAAVVKVPAVRLPKNFGFMLAHPSATVNPLKLEDYTIHANPPGISGSLVWSRAASSMTPSSWTTRPAPFITRQSSPLPPAADEWERGGNRPRALFYR